MIELINDNEFNYDGKIYATDNAYDVSRYIIGREEDTRILYDPRINTWYIGEAGMYTHAVFVVYGWKNGLYHDYDFKAEDEVLEYYGTNDFLYLYYYMTEPFKPNLTGDYEMHFVYDFGILDSHDIVEGLTIKFEDSSLYEILLPRLLRTEKEYTKKEEV